MDATLKYVCWGCLATGQDLKINSYTFGDTSLRNFVNTGVTMLCFKCKRYAEITECFIENVRFAQTLLQSMAPLTDSEIQDNIGKARIQMRIIADLRTSLVQTIDAADGDQCEGYTVLDHRAIIVKEENCAENKLFDEEHFVDADFDTSTEMKPDLDTEFLNIVKHEVELDDIKDAEFVLSRLAKKKTKRKAKERVKRQIKKIEVKKETKDKGAFQKSQIVGKTANIVQVVYLTMQQFSEERLKLSLEKKYVNASFRCERCVKGFTFKETYERHLVKHAEASGGLECSMCGQRWSTEEQLLNHRAGHFKRYRCLACGITRTSRLVIAEHHAAYHAPHVTFHCAHCDKSFLKRTLLKKHIAYAHQVKQRVVCQLCNKTYVNNDSLRSHMLFKHNSSEMPLRREHGCPHCPRTFRSPSHLRAHLVKHSEAREYYCVECDRHFKTHTILKQHLRVAQPHVNSKTLPLGCEHCERRFSVRRDLDQHVNKLHLNIKPHECDLCTKAYASSWSLKEHKKLAHEGYQRPLRFPCTMCDKVFTRSVILRDHMRTHTGERPFQCPKCPATFAQSGVLHTHNRLIHLKLQRNGKPKRNCTLDDSGKDHT